MAGGACPERSEGISGSFIPNQSLSTFDGESLNGDWQLNVSDRDGGGNTGTLVNWCLDATGPVMAQGGTSQPKAAGEEGGPPRLLARIVPRSGVMQAALSSVESLKELLLIGSSPASNEVWKSYYYAGGQRVAVRVQDPNAADVDATYYLLGDHLGSTSLTVDEGGVVIDERRYKPWGDVRYESSGAGVTDFGYTGQRQNDSFGLYFFMARYFDPVLGRFASADTIIPNPAWPAAYDRYAFNINNPLRYVDPTGHYPCGLPYYVPFCTPPNSTPGAGQQTSPTSSPPEEPPAGLGDDGLAGFEGINVLSTVTDAWWGVGLDAQEALAILLRAEISSELIIVNGRWEVPSLILRAITAKYNKYCSGGPWTPTCFNGFWGYYQPIRNANRHLSGFKKDDLRNFGIYGDVYMRAAGWVISHPNVGSGSDDPSEWATLNEYDNPVAYSTASSLSVGLGEGQAAYVHEYEQIHSETGFLTKYIFLVLTVNQNVNFCGGSGLCNITKME